MEQIPQKDEEELESYLDNKLQLQERERVEKRIQNFPDYDGYLEFLKMLKRATKKTRLEPAPPDMINKIMSNIYIPQQIPIFRKWIPILASASACLAIGFFLGRGMRVGNRMVPVRFDLLAPRAQSVSIAGDFTDWKAVHLRKRENRWETILEVPRGKYQYIYILNGKVFVVDPSVEEVEKDNRGNFYSVIDTTKGNKI